MPAPTLLPMWQLRIASLVNTASSQHKELLQAFTSCEKTGTGMAGEQPPAQFICPISLDVMRDPVLASDEQTCRVHPHACCCHLICLACFQRAFIDTVSSHLVICCADDRQSLLRLQQSSGISPLTREPLQAQFKRNHALRQLVEDWLEVCFFLLALQSYLPCQGAKRIAIIAALPSISVHYIRLHPCILENLQGLAVAVIMRLVHIQMAAVLILPQLLYCTWGLSMCGCSNTLEHIHSTTNSTWMLTLCKAQVGDCNHNMSYEAWADC